jgi:hypothetical protein
MKEIFDEILPHLNERRGLLFINGLNETLWSVGIEGVFTKE